MRNSGTQEVFLKYDCRMICRPVPLGSVSSANFTSYQKCPAGQYRDATMTDCMSCPLGHFSSKPGASICRPSPAGFVPSADSSTVVPCPAGSYSSAASVTCTLCPTGQQGGHQSHPITSDHDFKAGVLKWLMFTSNIKLNIYCLPYPPGTYTDTEGLPVCIPCAPGEFASAQGSTSCTDCPVGTVAPWANFSYQLWPEAMLKAFTTSVGHCIQSSGCMGSTWVLDFTIKPLIDHFRLFNLRRAAHHARRDTSNPSRARLTASPARPASIHLLVSTCW